MRAFGGSNKPADTLSISDSMMEITQKRNGLSLQGYPRTQSAQHSSLRIAYIGPAQGTSLHRARALERLGHSVTHIDPWAWLGCSKWIGRWLHHAGGFGVGLRIDRPLFKAVSAVRPDLIFVNQGEFLGPSLLRQLRMLGAPIINYINDNPFADRDHLRFRNLRKALAYYDLLAVPRMDNVEQARRLGARNVIRVWLTADEIRHRPRLLDDSLRQRYSAEVSFIGTWMPERGPLMAELLRRGVPLSIWGDRWQKAPEWHLIKSHWRGPGIYDDDNYAAAIQSSKICLGLLSKGNYDLHTTRSVEIPLLGGLLCAERTSEHLALYKEDYEAVFWKDTEECAVQCRRLLDDDSLRSKIAQRGHDRAQRNNLFNEPMLATIMKALNN